LQLLNPNPLQENLDAAKPMISADMVGGGAGIKEI